MAVLCICDGSSLNGENKVTYTPGTGTGIAQGEVMRIICLTIDCANPAAIAHFWNEALRWGGVIAGEGSGGATCHPPSGGTYLEFIRVPEEKTVKNRLHLGCRVETLDELDAEIARLQALGATIAWEEEFPPEVAGRFRNVILRDVEGNEFCLAGGRSASTP